VRKLLLEMTKSRRASENKEVSWKRCKPVSHLPHCRQREACDREPLTPAELQNRFRRLQTHNTPSGQSHRPTEFTRWSWQTPGAQDPTCHLPVSLVMLVATLWENANPVGHGKHLPQQYDNADAPPVNSGRTHVDSYVVHAHCGAFQMKGIVCCNDPSCKRSASGFKHRLTDPHNRDLPESVRNPRKQSEHAPYSQRERQNVDFVQLGCNQREQNALEIHEKTGQGVKHTA
jgi:hypothetical protein